MRRRARIDENQTDIVDGLRKIGATVLDLSGVGDGCPDLVVGYRGVNFLFEVKDGSKPPSRQKLTADQWQVFQNWKGRIEMVNSLSMAVAVVTGRGVG